MNYRERLEESLERHGSISESIIAAEMDKGFCCEYFATDNIKSLPACLDLRLSNGTRKALPYSHFTEINFDVTEGIEIITSSKKIKITGRDLTKLYDFLTAYRVRYVTSNLGYDVNEEGLFVKEIVIEDLI
jgi:hypothetical protein